MMNSLILILDAYSAIDLLTSATTPPPSCCLAFSNSERMRTSSGRPPSWLLQRGVVAWPLPLQLLRLLLRSTEDHLLSVSYIENLPAVPVPGWGYGEVLRSRCG
jgi:hypothetical protein